MRTQLQANSWYECKYKITQCEFHSCVRGTGHVFNLELSCKIILLGFDSQFLFNVSKSAEGPCTVDAHIYILIGTVPQQWPYTVFTKAKITGWWGDNKPLCSPWGRFPENIREWYTTGCLWRMHQDYCLQLLLSHLLIYWNITSCWRLNIEHVFFSGEVALFCQTGINQLLIDAWFSPTCQLLWISESFE